MGTLRTEIEGLYTRWAELEERVSAVETAAGGKKSKSSP
jgi:hypothetical protein